MSYKFYDFFAGGGMASFGLGASWECVFANDIDPKKAASYRDNLDGGQELEVKDVASVLPGELPGIADLAWASFPCQDLSLAGAGAGLNGGRSGTFWPFWRLMRQLDKEGRAPRLIVLENVYGAITSHGGNDFAAIASAFSGRGYRFGAVVIDARHFVPQSRPRLFIIGIRGDLGVTGELIGGSPSQIWHPSALINAHDLLSKRAKSQWIWWHLPKPAARNSNFPSIIEDEPQGVEWHSREKTQYILSLMTERNLSKVRANQSAGKRSVGTVYRRTRPDGNGGKVQRAEVRFDEISGCLRTPSGGSSRQTLLIVEGENIRSRLLSPREAARLMGLPDYYILPARYNDAYHLAGDGVVVPVVRFLAENILQPLLNANREDAQRAA